MSQDKISVGFAPSIGEELQAYAQRLKHIIAEHRGYSLGHYNWFTHRGAGACWICDIMNVAEFSTDLMYDVAKEDKKHIWRCTRKPSQDPNRMDDPLSFVFKPHRK